MMQPTEYKLSKGSSQVYPSSGSPFLKVRPHGRTASVRQTLLPYHKAKEEDVISVETREVDVVTDSGSR